MIIEQNAKEYYHPKWRIKWKRAWKMKSKLGLYGGGLLGYGDLQIRSTNFEGPYNERLYFNIIISAYSLYWGPLFLATTTCRLKLSMPHL